MKPAQFQERLTARHLQDPEETEALKEAVQEAAQPVGNAVEKSDPREEKAWTFHLRWTDGKARAWEGEFTNKILTIAEQQQVSILEAKLCGGMPYDSIDQATRNINHAIAHMVYSISDSPQWAKDLRKLEDPLLIIAIYQEVASHEATFFGLGEA